MASDPGLGEVREGCSRSLGEEAGWLETEISLRSWKNLVWPAKSCHTSCSGPLEEAESWSLKLNVFLWAQGWFGEDSVFPIPWAFLLAEEELRGCSWALHSALQCLSFYYKPGSEGPLG